MLDAAQRGVHLHPPYPLDPTLTIHDSVHVYVNIGVLKIILKMALIVFGPPESVFRYEAAPKEEQVVYIRRKRVGNLLVIMLGSYILTFGLFTLMVFWDISLLSESHDCAIDCFSQTDIANATSGPIKYCVELEMQTS